MTPPKTPLNKYQRFKYAYKLQNFALEHSALEKRVEAYIDAPRRNFYTPDDIVVERMSRANARFLYSVNFAARLQVAKVLRKIVLNDEDGLDGPFFFVTVVPKRYVLSLKKAATINVFSLQQLTRLALHGSNFIGMVEPALYKGWGPRGPTPGRDHVSWHSHNFVFGSSREELEASIIKIGNKHVSINGGAAVHVKEITRDEIENYLLYSLKAPLKEYRLNRFKGEWVDPDTGEVFQNVRQQTRAIRTGDFLRLMDVMKDMKLTDLIFAGSEGKDLIARLKTEVAVEKVLARRAEEDFSQNY